MNALVEQVRDFLRGASSKVTAKLIADAVKATPIEVGKALDELKGLRHADRDGMNRWHITERGRLGTPPDPPPAAKKRNALLPDRGKTKIQLIVEAIGNESLTVPEIAERTKLPKEIVGQNISVSGKKYGLITDGKRGTYHLWRRVDGKLPADVDRAAIAAGQDKEEAATTKPDINVTGFSDEASLKTLSQFEEAQRIAERMAAKVANIRAAAEPADVRTLIADVCDEVKALLLEKNRKYGNSALQPMRVFSRADPIEQINVRLDDKLSRLLTAQADDEEDAEFDLLGYLVLKRVAKRLPR